MDATTLRVGQRVYSGLYGGRDGIISKVHGEQRPDNVRALLGGAMVMGGNAEVDVVFDNGTHLRRISEAIVRGVQWKVRAEIAPQSEIDAALAYAAEMSLGTEIAQDIAKAAFAAEVASLRADPAWSHLKQSGPGVDHHCGKLAAANIRAELRRAFPGVKFSVIKQYYGEVRIRWAGGPQAPEVEAITGRYVAKSFDGMQDLASSVRSAWTEVFGCGGYAMTSRELTSEEQAAADADYQARCAGR